MLRDAPDYTTGRIYGPTGQATASFPVPGTYVFLDQFQQWQREAMDDNTRQSAAALAAAYASVGVAPPASAAIPLPAAAPIAQTAPASQSGSFSLQSVPWYVWAAGAGFLLLSSARK